VLAGVPSKKIPIRLQRQVYSSAHGTPRRFGVEVDNHPIDQTRYVGKESPIVPEEHAQGLLDREHNLTMWQVKQYLFGEVFGEEQDSFLMI
jgi:hypothetical protein